MPSISKPLLANLHWKSETPLRFNTPYLVRHAGQILCGCVTRVRDGAGLTTCDAHGAKTLQAGDASSVEVETHRPIIGDSGAANPATGSFALIDPVDGRTIAEGTILDASLPHESSANSVPADRLGNVAARPQTKGLAVWFTGLSAAGKTTICRAVHAELSERGIPATLLDADDLRQTLNRDLGFSKEDRDENIRRIGFVAYLLTRQGAIALVAAISPYRDVRAEVRETIGNFLEVYVDTPLAVCEGRDPKGLYKRVRARELQGFTGIDDPYEPPLLPEIRCDTSREDLATSTDRVVTAVLRAISPKQD